MHETINGTNCISLVALFDNAAPLKSSAPRSDFKGETHSQTVGGLGARLSHIG